MVPFSAKLNTPYVSSPATWERFLNRQRNSQLQPMLNIGWEEMSDSVNRELPK
jgi:hypothetical protein